jgi:hypothetical protein
MAAGINQGALDRYTAAHAASGVLLRTCGRVRWWHALLIAVAWEVVERPMKTRLPGIFEPDAVQDSWLNMASDVVALMVGYGAGRLIDGGDVGGRVPYRF